MYPTNYLGRMTALIINGLIPSYFSIIIISRFWLNLGVNISKDKYYQLVVGSHEDFAAKLMIYLHGNNIEDSEKQDILTSVEFGKRSGAQSREVEASGWWVGTTSKWT